jgi:predicted nuclease of predicted toxin-antitoxin system
VKFIIDAQLPMGLCEWLCQQGHDCIHTMHLTNKNRTSDAELLLLAEVDSRVIVTKDSDFLDSFYIKNQPNKLLLVSTGNLSNANLLLLFSANHSRLIDLFKDHRLIEIDKQNLTVHR